jgi:hypothetical protein
LTIRAHIESNLEVRASLSARLRAAPLEGPSQLAAMRAVRALEDVEADLCNVAALVRSYVTYLLARLETLEETFPDDRVSTAADLLFESTGDREAAEAALDVLCSTATPVSARVLAHAISEPLLDEDLESRAFATLKTFWPLPRAYMLYNLREHPHEDIPIRWFQLFVEMDELTTVELILEELRAHAENPGYHEDLNALVNVLRGCRDPELEEKVLAVLNSGSATNAAIPFLREFLKEHRPMESAGPTPWTRRADAIQVNRKYRAAAALQDQGKNKEALQALAGILNEAPDYPFALMLQRLAQPDRWR